MKSITVLVAAFFCVVATLPAMPVGINLDFFWGFEWASVDLFRYARPFREYDPARPVSWEERLFPLRVDADGYPIELRPGTEAQTLIGGRPPRGEYVLTWDGDGEITVPFGARRVGGSGRRLELVVDYDPAVGWEHLIQITIRRPDPANPVRNIRLVPKELENTAQENPFHPLFLERLAPFSVIRFLNWQHTNQGPGLVRWSARTRRTGFGWGDFDGQGVPVEYMVELANATGASPWFTIHHTADDEFIRNFAALVRDRLRPEIPAYFEWSNEVWNGIFAQHRYAIREGEDLGLWPRPGTGPHETAWAYTAVRSVEMFTILESVFGATAMGTRVKRVLPGWVVADPNVQIATQRVGGVPAHARADVFAIAPYFAHFNQINTELLGVTPAELIRVMRDREMPVALNAVAETRAAFENEGIRLPIVAYEAGQHLADYTAQWRNTELGDLYVAANRHPAMRELYAEYLSRLETVGLALVNLYRSSGPHSGYGSFGLIEHQDQDLSFAPKYRGVLDFIER